MADAFPDELAEYDDPVLYDLENAVVDELPILLPLAEASGGPILDLACGTGRTTLPLAEAGFAITGVDLSEPMLEHARLKARERGLSIEFHRQDCTALDLPLTARMATMTGHAFQEFYPNEAQDQLLRSVDRHLASGGVFVFDSRLPSPSNLHKPEGELPWLTTTDAQGRTVDISVIWQYDVRTQLQDYLMIERFVVDEQVVEEKRTRGRLRYTWPREMERLLDLHGFDLETLYGEWDGSPLAVDSYDMVVVARKRA